VFEIDAVQHITKQTWRKIEEFREESPSYSETGDPPHGPCHFIDPEGKIGGVGKIRFRQNHRLEDHETYADPVQHPGHLLEVFEIEPVHQSEGV